MKKIYFCIIFCLTNMISYSQELPFIMTIETVSTNEIIGIPINNEINTNYTIDYGDGTTQIGLTSFTEHTYALPGTYAISITGSFSIRFEWFNSANRVKSIEQWGNHQWQSMNKAFYNCINMVINATDAPDLTQVTDMSLMFYNCHLVNQNINNWDVSNVTNMEALFFNATAFNSSLSNWDVSNVINMNSMFKGAVSYNKSLNTWNVSNVQRLDYMFSGATSFNQPLNNWNVSNVFTIANIFEDATSFNQNISNWNVSNVLGFDYAFKNATSFNQPLNQWDVSSGSSFGQMFNGAVLFNQPLNSWVISNANYLVGMFDGAISFNQNISGWNYLLADHNDFVNNSGLDYDNYDALLNAFLISGVEYGILGAGGLNYCDATTRNYLIEEKHWNIFGDTESDYCPKNNIVGHIYIDENLNGCDANDIEATGFLINATGLSFDRSTISFPETGYNLGVRDSIYNISMLNVPDYFTVSPQVQSVSFTGFNNTQTVNFCLIPNQSVQDLNIALLPISSARPGFVADYQIIVENKGTYTINNANVSLTFDSSKQNFVSSNPTATVVGNALQFNLTNLHPFETKIVSLRMQTFVPPIVNDGDVLNFVATVATNNSDATPNDNIFELSQNVINAFDPNDKIVLEGSEIYVEQIGDYLHYIIMFQNTGSANANKVKIKDNLHYNLDWNTFQPLSSSHNYEMKITNGYQLDFIFEDINLPYQVANETGSHGFVSYKVKPLSSIQVGDFVGGYALIYFDYNDYIMTSSNLTTVVSQLKVDDFLAHNLRIYPNPANDRINIVNDDKVMIQEVSIYSLQGNRLKRYNENLKILDVSNLNSGIYVLIIKTDKGLAKYKLVKN